MKLIGKTQIDFIGMRRFSFVLSAIMVIVGFVSLAIIALGQADLSIDFAGGTLLQGSFTNTIDIGELRSRIEEAGFADPNIQEVFGTKPNTFLIRVKIAGVSGEQTTAEVLTAAIAQTFPDNEFLLDSVHEVGPTIGRELQEQAIKAIVIALICILVYIWIRFDFRFSVAATITTFHDVLFVLGIMFILQREISLLVVSALLTLAGYSLSDTVVVFDRIRENLRTFRKRGDFVATVNASINEVLSRTLMTSLTTFLAVIAVLMLGGNVVRDFALALTFGVVIGTYSSIFIASPVIVVWEAKSPKRFK